MNIIEVGDEITNEEGHLVVVTLVEKGKYGLLVRGTFVNTGTTYEGYYIAELPPVSIKPWYGWAGRYKETLANGHEVGCVDLLRIDARQTTEEYDKEWERTLETMRLEQMSGTHTPNNTLQSRPFTEQSRPDVL